MVGEMFAAMGAQVIQADGISHELMLPGEAVYREVVEHFGAGILDPDGTVNRARLAELAFGGRGKPSRVQELNQIVHPAVIRRQEEWIAEVGRRDPHAIAMVEAALILEAGWQKALIAGRRDLSSGAAYRALGRRLKVDLETARREVTRRMAAQLPDEEKIKAADYVIDNSGSLG